MKTVENISTLKIFLAGLLMIFIGLVYGTIFAGIPYQDPTPEMLASYAMHSRITNIILTTGAVFTIVSLAGYIFNRYVRS